MAGLNSKGIDPADKCYQQTIMQMIEAQKQPGERQEVRLVGLFRQWGGKNDICTGQAQIWEFVFQ
jgi:hypothetical protein